MSINERVKKRAKELGMTVEEVEQKSGLGKRTIYSWDKNSPSVDKVKRVADLLQTTPAYIMGWGQSNVLNGVAIEVQHLIMQIGWRVFLDEEDAGLYLIHGSDVWEITEEQLNTIVKQMSHYLDFLLNDLAKISRKVH